MRLPIPVVGLILAAPLTALTSLAPVQIAVAQVDETAPGPSGPKPEFEHFYVGRDGRQFSTGADGTSIPNPNYDRLTFLFSHLFEDSTNNHFHSIGAYSITGGTPDNPIISPTNTNNRIPELYTQQPPITLVPGTGVFDNKYISVNTENEYTNLTIRPVNTLVDIAAQGDVQAQNLYNATSSQRWQGLLGDAEVALQLLSITPGLGVANSEGVDLFASGDTYTIGRGDDFSFTPTFYTASSAPAGNYSAQFRLLDVNTANGRTPIAQSGTFNFDFQVAQVPEPSTVFSIGVLGVLAFVCKNRIKVKAN